MWQYEVSARSLQSRCCTILLTLLLLGIVVVVVVVNNGKLRETMRGVSFDPDSSNLFFMVPFFYVSATVTTLLDALMCIRL